ncbi:hypothetical protein MLOOGBEN_21670 [Bacillus sp. EB106-08-02-XG196]|uniref:hypothetical protein n=1 Tax=Bacillus sp. EB106-08-02-XG196 TaxID=2737049 RepID=UPI0015C49B31|nr:hypothetical protein [Bacillus sp. EB106-08-02-XG196]NWQ43313.1 hypothetical protein [Bacillus sp. EB106-08-02-XG196]
MINIDRAVNDLHELNIDRDAFRSISGYFYQFELTLLHILYDGTEQDPFKDNPCNAIYKVETIEDYVKYYESNGRGFIRLAQMKHHDSQTSNSTYYGAVLRLYFTYLKFLEKEEDKIELKAAIFFYDMSPVKSINKVLEAAMNSENKKLESIINTIKDIGLDSIENRIKFSKLTTFEKTENHAAITNKLKHELSRRYQMLQPSHTPDRLYASAVSKLIQDSGNEIGFTLESLNSYFVNEVEVPRDFYKLKIIDYVKGIINVLVNENIRNIHPFYSNEIKESYSEIYVKVIIPFIEEKFETADYRYSFLQTVTPNDFSQEIVMDSIIEYECFLEASNSIKQTMANLAKILFYYLESGKEVRLDEWFDINDNGWLFTYPDEQRGSGVLIGSFNSDVFTSMSYMLPRLKETSLRPDVWYVKHHNIDEISSSKALSYEVDFTSPPEEVYRHIYAQPGDEHFHIQCLGCLATERLWDCSNVNNIFKDKCHVKGDQEE